MNERTAGTLYLVGTPIGNLEDVTLRALRVLSEVDLVAAEDTRVTRRLLERHEIRARLVSYHAHSARARREEIVAALKSGRSAALVSDAGMPGISDPGADLVREARSAGARVVVVPGPTAVSAALALSGIPAQQYLFLGFPPARAAARRRALEEVKFWQGPLVCFEAPHRLLRTLEDMRESWGDRQAAAARELTKRFEEVQRGPLSTLIAHFTEHEPRGEFTLVVAGAERPKASLLPSPEALEEVRALVSAGLSPSRAAAHVAKHRNVSRRSLYEAYLAERAEGEGK